MSEKMGKKIGEERCESNNIGNVPIYRYFCILRDNKQTGRIIYGCIVVTEFGPLKMWTISNEMH